MKLKNMFFRLSLPSLGLGSALFIAWGAEESLGRGGGHMVLSWNREGSAVAKRVRTTQWGIKKILYCDTTDIRRPSGGK